MPEIRLRPGLRPGPRCGSLQRSPRPLAGFKRPTSKGRRGDAREGGMGGKGEEREGEGREGKRRGGKGRDGGLTRHLSLLSAAPAYNHKP